MARLDVPNCMYTIHPCQSISVCVILHYLLSRWICISVSALYFSQYKLALFVASMNLCICAAQYFSTDRELFRDLKITATDPGLQWCNCLFCICFFVLYFYLSSNYVILFICSSSFLTLFLVHLDWNLKITGSNQGLKGAANERETFAKRMPFQ